MQKKVILITGASRGIGREIAKELSKQNIVIANYNKSEDEAKKLEQENENVEIFRADVTQNKEVKNMVNYIVNKYGKIDVLINNAGIAQTKLFTDITSEDFDIMMKNNVYSVFYTTQQVVKHMIREQNGCIINISSVWGITGGSCEVHYSMSKAAIDGMTKALAKELGLSNIRVNSIAPGCIETDMTKNLSDEDWESILEEGALRKRGKVQDISKCVKWLIEDEYTTGQVISPNGGLVI